MESQERQCQDFIQACIRKRVSPERFRGLLTTFHDKHPALRIHLLLSALFKGSKNGGADDPRIPLYVKEILRLRVASLADVLSSLLPPPLEPISSGQNAYHDQTMLEIGGSQKPTIQAMVFQVMLVEATEGSLKTKSEVQALLKALIAWMSLIPGSTTLGYFVSAILGITITQETLSQPSMEGNRA